jgi:hypothetical protein
MRSSGAIAVPRRDIPRRSQKSARLSAFHGRDHDIECVPRHGVTPDRSHFDRNGRNDRATV